jgi:hypothetical protein
MYLRSADDMRQKGNRHIAQYVPVVSVALFWWFSRLVVPVYQRRLPLVIVNRSLLQPAATSYIYYHRSSYTHKSVIHEPQ